MDRRGRTREVAAVLLIALALAMVSAPLAAADRRGPGGQARVTLAAEHGDGLLSRVGSWFVQMVKALVGETDGEGTDASAGMDPTNSGEATTDPSPGALIGLPSGS